jgi:diguanylate cyclase (GGDEF)-like protein/PAS domain S-box-containing protein
MGRRLDDGMLSMLSHRTGVPIRYATATQAPSGFPSAEELGEGPLIQEDPGGRLLHGFRLFRTTTGVPALIVRTATDRPIAQAGRPIAITIGLYSLLLAGLVWWITWLAFRRWITDPLGRIESALGALDLDSGDARLRDPFRALPVSGDEMGHIASVLQEMNARMQDSHRRMLHLNERLESDVEARTADLMKAHRQLILYGKVLASTSEGMLVTDTAGTILDVNEAMCMQSGFTRGELIGQNPRILKSSRHGIEFYQHLWSTLLSTGYWSGEIWDRKSTGEIYPKWLTISTIFDSDGRPSHFVGLSIDISAIKSAEERLQQLAYYDQLTGLPNRSLFSDRLRRSILRTQRKRLLSALLFLDLDRFKNINDTLGHTVGDALLVRVSERIKARLRESDTVCRMGGDEFTVILGEIAHLEDAGQVAADLIDSLAKRFDVEGHEIYVGASVGIALCPLDGQDEETLVKKADAAMYAAKEAGRCTFRFASGELDAVSRRRMEIESKLHGAIERNEMVLHLQPIALSRDAAGGSPSGLVGAEALIRWVPEPGVMLGPGTFIEIAEDAGLIPEIGEWVIREACREAKRWQEAGLALTVSVNVSARQFEENRLPRFVRSALAESGLPPHCLRLEVTESAFMRNMDKVIGIMDELRSLGVFFAIDDFGTGYSSLQYIKCLPAHSLKIDKAFVSGVAANLSDAEIVSAIIALSRAFGLICIAEGVETEDQLRELKERGCDEVQGYLIARPMPADDFLAFALSGLGSKTCADPLSKE